MVCQNTINKSCKFSTIKWFGTSFIWVPEITLVRINLNLLNFWILITGPVQLRLNHMFNIFHSLGPSYFNQFFTKISVIHSHATWPSSFNFHIPRNWFIRQNTLSFTRLPWIGIICLNLINVLLSLPRRSTLLEMPGWFMSLLTLTFWPPLFFCCFVLFLVPGTCFLCLWDHIGIKFALLARLYGSSWHLDI